MTDVKFKVPKNVPCVFLNLRFVSTIEKGSGHYFFGVLLTFIVSLNEPAWSDKKNDFPKKIIKTILYT